MPDLASVGGVSNYYSALALEQRDERIEYFHVNTAERSDPFRLIQRLLRDYWRFWKKISTGDYGLVVANPSLNPRSFYRDALFCWLSVRRKQPLTVFVRGWSAALERQIRRQSLQRWLFSQTFARAREFIVLGEVFKRKLIEMGCSPDSRFWVETTVADDSGLAEFSVGTRLYAIHPLRILFMSRLIPDKGAATALDAFLLAQKELSDDSIELVIAGDGPELPALRRRVEVEEVRGVHFIGGVASDQRRNLFESCDIFLFPTRHGEGMPNVILEAMLYGMPIVTRPVGSIPEVVQHGLNGFLSESTDERVFAEWILLLASDSTLRRRMSLTNHKKARDLYTTEKVRSRFMAIIDQLMAADRTAPERAPT